LETGKLFVFSEKARLFHTNILDTRAVNYTLVFIHTERLHCNKCTLEVNNVTFV